MAKKTPTITRRFVHTPRPVPNGLESVSYVDYKDVKLLRQYVSRYMKIDPRRRSGLSAKTHRAVTRAIKRARILALIPFTLH